MDKLSIVGKWKASLAPFDVELFKDGTCIVNTPSEKNLRGKYSFSGKVLEVFSIDADGDEIVNTFDVLHDSLMEMRPPRGRDLPPLPFSRV